MLENNLITIQQYAIKHKMSTFAVLKLINAKKLQTVKKSVDGEETEFIVDATLTTTQTPKNEPSHEATLPSEQGAEKINYEVEFHKLLAKYIELNEKYTKLMEEKHRA